MAPLAHKGGMFIPFFLELKAAKVPVSLREYLSLLEGMEAQLVDYDVEGFYYLARATLVKDERHIDASTASSRMSSAASKQFPARARSTSPTCRRNGRRLAEKHLTDGRSRRALGGFDKRWRP